MRNQQESKNNNITTSKKCEICGVNILVESSRQYRPDDSAFKRTVSINRELSHYCDGGESKFIDAHEFSGLRAKAEAWDNFKEWA